jgi:putative endonuclease
MRWRSNSKKRSKAQHFGVRAEKIAALFLRAKGYRILAERYRAASGEIDLVAQHGRTLIAVEVKARRHAKDLTESVTPHKQARMAHAMETLIANDYKIAGLAARRIDTMRFDVIYIAPRSWPVHIKDAWRLS